MVTKLAKIEKVKFGLGGYQDVQIVYEFVLSGDGWGTTHTLECGWGHISEEELKDPKSSCKWTHEDRLKSLAQNSWKVLTYMKKAKVDSLDKLKGIPVKVYFESEFGRNTGFDILTEVL
jgi:hypothetical protein